ncbi:hypothetical protein LPW26_20290 [Rhodopseudomonas sp. HC1]|uniref:hypothetical protein n=1 Tax=Rhodopseudomonas infernalis TaxID=2897386 RepID=UPI001EE93C3A|nr:hypothetical protein [Rhodopseudomonas infernalis]MCG6206990.1 hypothetical protein [Rhodopseudomonas infernalis]
MTKIVEWDDAYLKQCEANERRGAVEALTDADWLEARRQLFQELSDTYAGYASCPSAKCRRARRCVGDGPECCAQLQVGIPADVERDLCDEIYHEIQQHRRDAACSGDASR